MDIKTHFNLILDKYELHSLYYKFIGGIICNNIVRESFYWSLIYFNDIIQNKPELLPQYSGILLFLYGINIPIQNYATSIKNEFIKQIKLANFKYFSEKIINIKKDTLLNFDLIEYYHALDHFNDHFQEYIISQQHKCEIPIKFITIIVIALNQKFPLLIGLGIVFISIVIVINERKLISESQITNDLFDLENQIRNYMINSKQFIVNDEFNKVYITNNIEHAESLNKSLLDMNNNLDYTLNIMMFILIIIVFYIKKDNLTCIGFLYYFLMIYDIEFIANSFTEYYKSKINYNKMVERLVYLNNIKQENIINNKEDMTQFFNKDPVVIMNINNTNPNISITNPIIIDPGEHILIEGSSGSGKTSLLYTLKGMITCNQLQINPNINTIKEGSYMVLSNNKSIFSGNLYDIISNYDSNPNVELIKYALENSKLEHKFTNGNIFVDIEQLSGGEKIRLLIARMIYLIKKDNNHSILLFDEIDENLNNILATEIVSNILNIFNDKIILYITHNEMVKKLFKRKLIVKDGVISQ